MIRGKNVLIIGAGNTGRPAADLLNYLSNDVSDIMNLRTCPKKH